MHGQNTKGFISVISFKGHEYSGFLFRRLDGCVNV